MLFNRPRGNTWEPVWSFTADGLIWLLRISGSGRVVCEVRNPEKRTARYACLAEQSGAVLWQDLAFDENWWVGIEEVQDERIYFHCYRKPDLPQHLGITAVDIETGAMLWENRDATFLFAVGNEVFVSRRGFEEHFFYALDASNGDIARELGSDPAPINKLRRELDDNDAFASYEYPRDLTEAERHPDEHSRLLDKYVDRSIVKGPLDTLARGHMLVASWHEEETAGGRSAGALTQKLLALDIVGGKELYKAVINSQVATPSIDSFFAKEDLLFYIKDGNTLFAHRLPSQTRP